MANWFYSKTKWQAFFERMADSEARVFKMTLDDKQTALSRANSARNYLREHKIGTVRVMQSGNEVYFAKAY